jgi:hypothetical protein
MKVGKNRENPLIPPKSTKKSSRVMICMLQSNHNYFITKINMSDEVQGYCVKCKAKRTMADAVEVKMKNGRFAMKGKCEACGCGMYKILGTKK